MKWSSIVGFFNSSKRRGDVPEDQKEVGADSSNLLPSAVVSAEPAESAAESNEVRYESSTEIESNHSQVEVQSPASAVKSSVKPPVVPDEIGPEVYISQADPDPPAVVVPPLQPAIKSEAEKNESAWAAIRYRSQPIESAASASQMPAYAQQAVEIPQTRIEMPTSHTPSKPEPLRSTPKPIPEADLASDDEPKIRELSVLDQNDLHPAPLLGGLQANRFSMLHSMANRWSHPLPKRQILVPVATRAEARRLAPVVRTLHARFAMTGKRDQICVCAIGDHAESVKEALNLLGLPVDCEVGIPSESMTVDALRARVLNSFEEILAQVKPEWMVVAGNTLISGMAALAAYHAGVQVARVEASHSPQPDISDPNDIHRQLVDLFSTVHFTETASNKDALTHTGIPQQNIFVVGNTGVDALLESCTRLGLPLGMPSSRSSGTTHVFVSIGDYKFSDIEQREICRAIGNLSVLVPGLYHFLWSLPEDRSSAENIRKILSDVPGIELIPCCDYEDLLRSLNSCDFVLTDSMDIQEEAPSLGKPVLMLGPISDRSEAVRAGVVIPITPHSASIQSAVRALARKLSTRHGQVTNPSGDGRASARIADFFEGRQVLEFGRPGLPRLVPSETSMNQLPNPAPAFRLG